jgi:hypothetical protein
VTLVRSDVSEEPGASFIRVTKIGELGTIQAATSNRRTLRRNTKPHGVTTQKTPFFIVTAVKTSNLTHSSIFVSPSFRTADCGTELYLVVKKLRRNWQRINRSQNHSLKKFVQVEGKESDLFEVFSNSVQPWWWSDMDIDWSGYYY